MTFFNRFDCVSRRSSTRVRGLIVAFVVLGPTALRAQDSDIAGTLYSQGVEAFFAGRSTEADAYLSRAIAINPDDPRAFYFRSLSRLREGRQAEAQADMQTGADIEARQPNRFAIGKALERVQGPARLLLEQYRWTARLSHASANRPVQPVLEPDAPLLRERRVVPLDEFSQPGAPRAVAVPAAAPPATSTPANSSAKSSAVPSKVPPAAAAPDPFGDDSAPQTPPKAPASKSPPATAAPKSPPPAQKPAAEEENPFR